MTQPDLVSKLRELKEKWRKRRWNTQHAEISKNMCADELESLLGREGQAAPLKPNPNCPLCQGLGSWVEGEPCGCTKPQPAPSTPIVPGTPATASSGYLRELSRLGKGEFPVPGTAGLSALLERIALDLSELKVMHTDYAGYIVHNSDPTQQQLEYDKHCPACVIKQVLEAIKLNAALAERPAQAGEVKEERE